MSSNQQTGEFNGVVVSFNSKKQAYRFLEKIKLNGGKWMNGDAIVLPRRISALPNMFFIYVDSNLSISHVSAMYLRTGAFNVVDYPDFSFDLLNQANSQP